MQSFRSREARPSRPMRRAGLISAHRSMTHLTTTTDYKAIVVVVVVVIVRLVVVSPLTSICSFVNVKPPLYQLWLALPSQSPAILPSPSHDHMSFTSFK